MPSIYTTVRVFFLGQLPGEWSFSIAGQLSWVNLLYEILNEAQKGRNELAIDIKEICRWIKDVIPEYVICDTKSENITQSMDCIDKEIRDCFHDYMEEAGFTFASIASLDDRKEYIRW